MFGHHFDSLVFVCAQSDALPIGKHEPLTGANFLDDVLGHFGAQPAENLGILNGELTNARQNALRMIAMIEPHCLIGAGS
jgi:hypothetical protein